MSLFLKLFDAVAGRHIGLLLGTSYPDEAGAQTFQVGFTPSNFTPADSGAGEGSDKISSYLYGIDAKLGSLASGVTFTDQYFTGSGSVSTFSPGTPLTSGAEVDVCLNGQTIEEDGTSGPGWHRDVSANEVVYLFNGTQTDLPNTARLKVRIYAAVSFVDQLFSGPGPTFTITAGFSSGTHIDLLANGQYLEEGPQWTRDTVDNQVTVIPTIYSTTRIRVRVWL